MSILKKNINYIKKYGFSLYTFKIVVFLLGKKLKKSKKKSKLFSKILTAISLEKEKMIKDFLRKNLVFPKDLPINKELSTAPKNIIWQMWWQGVEEAPDLVKLCIEKTKKENPDKEVIVVDKQNINQYLNIPEDILVSTRKENFHFALFSDYVRFSLLSQYGGLWLDSTCLTMGNIPSEIFNYEFYTSKNVLSNELTPRYPITARIQSFFIVSEKGGVFVTTVKKLIEQLIRRDFYDLDYLIVYYIMEILIEDYEDVKAAYSKIPDNNKNIITVLNKLGSDCISEISSLLHDGETYIFKLTYKLKNKSSLNYREIMSYLKSV